MLTRQSFRQGNKTLVEHFLDDASEPERLANCLTVVEGFVDLWRAGEVWRARGLYQALGFNEDEYRTWLDNPLNVAALIARRRSAHRNDPSLPARFWA